MNINKLIGVLALVWVIVLGLLFHVRTDEPDVAGDTAVATATGTLEMAFLDIGQGDATFITFADGQQMLVDCAIDSRILEALGRVMPFYDRSIDYLVVTHPDKDHYGGCIDVLERFDVGTVVYNGFEKSESVFYYAFLEAIATNNVEMITLQEPTKWSIASTTVEYLYPVTNLSDDPDIPGFDTETGSNNSSIVMLLDHGDTEILMSGDGEEELEEFLLREYGTDLDIDILKSGHHGSHSSSIEPYVSVTSPSHVVHSAGFENSYGHPSARVLKRFERVGARNWRTDTMGDILVTITHDHVIVNGETFEIDTSNND